MTLAIPTDAPLVPGPPQGRWTLSDWAELPDDGNRYEIIDGILYMTTAPRSFHQWIIGQLARFVGIPAQDRGLAYTFFAPIGLIMPGCDPVQPDFVLVLRSNASILREGRIMGVPNLVVEVLSPGSVAYDTETKLHAYARAGVPEYMVVDPRSRTVRHYTSDTPGHYAGPRVYAEQDAMAFSCLPTISLTIGDLFAGAPDTTLD